MDEPVRTLIKPRVHDQVVKALTLRILNGEFSPGSPLPPEHELRDWLQISRSALREAVKVLSTKGLVITRPRVGTVVRARDEWDMLDPDLLSWAMDLLPSAEIVLSLIEARQAIEPAAVRLAAARATEADLLVVETALNRMASARDRRDFAAFNRADIEFHQGLLRASHNLVFRQLSAMIEAALAYAFRITIEPSQGASLPQHVEVFELVKARDADGAYRAMSRLLDVARVDLGLSMHSTAAQATDR